MVARRCLDAPKHTDYSRSHKEGGLVIMCGAISTVCLNADCSNWVRYQALCSVCRGEQ